MRYKDDEFLTTPFWVGTQGVVFVRAGNSAKMAFVRLVDGTAEFEELISTEPYDGAVYGPESEVTVFLHDVNEYLEATDVQIDFSQWVQDLRAELDNWTFEDNQFRRK